MKKIISLLLMFLLIVLLLATPVNAYVNVDEIESISQIYSAEFEESLMENWGIYKDDDWYSYGELYEYYSSYNHTETPDWYLVKGYLSMAGCAPCYGVLDIYYLETLYYHYPQAIPYFIYVPNENKFYTLEYAYNKGFAGIESIFTEYFIPQGLAKIIGDADKDNKLTIIDATLIQLALADCCELDDEYVQSSLVYGETLEFTTDIDRDGQRTILDATAIQYKLAGLE